METPPFVLRIDELRPTPGILQREDGNHWRPPRPNRSNQISRQGAWLLYNSASRQSMMQLSLQPGQAVPPNTQHFQTYSMYYSEGTFWIVDYDASRSQVGSGSQAYSQDEEGNGDSDDSDSEGENTMDWKSLSFSHTHPPSNDCTSFATVGCNNLRLIVERPDQQVWVNQLLPDRYHAPIERRILDPRDPRGPRGGMVGKLSILLGLIAFSVPEAQVSAALAHCIQPRGWRPHGGPRMSGWSDRRGIVVRTYACATAGQSNAAALTAFENGRPFKAYR